MNNNSHEAKALLGVMSLPSYISIGDPYDKKAKATDSREKGAQFKADFPKKGVAGALPNEALFDKEHKWLYGGEKYIDRTMYLTTQPPDTRKLGFGSRDAYRSDEFTQDMEVQKWRERLRTEMEFAERFSQQQKDSRTAEEIEEAERLAAPPAKRWSHGPARLFDVGKEATGGTTPYNPREARDKWYSHTRVIEENDGVPHRGGYSTSSIVVGDNLKGYSGWSKPEFARQPIIRDSFYRTTGALR
mgnify:CR=1 FL=1